MLNFTEAKLGQIIVHKIGKKTEDEGIFFSENKIKLNGELINDLLLKFFLSPFNEENFYKFHHESDIKLNEAYSFSSEIFDNSENFFEQSKNLARHLYEQSNHPKIKEGEFYTVEIKNCMIHDELVDAIGLFKTENKDTFLKVEEKDKNLEIDYENGININKLDKGCLIFNTEKENGYILSMVDNINKSNEAQYWRDNFLKIKPREDNYFFTQNYLTMCKTFVEKELKDLEKNDQIALKNDTMQYFKEKEEFNISEFEEEVIANESVTEMFREYKQTYADEHEISMSDEFEISENAVKKAKLKYRSIIKLDKNFHIYVHSNQDLMDKGYDDEKGKKYYTLYFDKEK